MWVSQRQTIRQGWSERVFLTSAGRTLSFAEVIAGWRDNEEFRAFFIAELAATDFPAFFWEMPPIRRGHPEIDYEYVTIRSDGLEQLHPDARAFESKFSAPVHPGRSRRSAISAATHSWWCQNQPPDWNLTAISQRLSVLRPPRNGRNSFKLSA